MIDSVSDGPGDNDGSQQRGVTVGHVRQRVTGSLVVICALALAAAGATSAVAAEGDSVSLPRGGTALPPITKQGDDAGAEVARGVIVSRAHGSPGVRALTADADAWLASTDVGRVMTVAPRIHALVFDSPVSLQEAEVVATHLARQPGVLHAMPDTLTFPASEPVIPNDPMFPEQWYLWHESPAAHSIRAPLAWQVTKGSPDVVVAVLDYGIATHPDLEGQIVSGYDFVSEVERANDGNSWDPDPADPGNWVTDTESESGFFEGCQPTNSNWHGTHVAGLINAIQGNGIGISGTAPGVRVQSVRVMGKCGGWFADMIAGITWASGGTVPGVPPNPTPARVINASMGGRAECEPLWVDVIAQARARGTLIVAAAMNSNDDFAEFAPANCPGVVSVAATSAAGTRAHYSNYGTTPTAVTIAAPGGDWMWDSRVLSTFNTGERGPELPSYEYQQGTSMAAPLVSAGAAMAFSLGMATPDEVEAALVNSVRPFPSGSDCTGPKYCGAGILDLAMLTDTAPTPTAPRNVSATPGNSRIDVAWRTPASDGGLPISAYMATATPGGATCTTARLSCTIIGLSNGTAYTVTVTATSRAGTSPATAGVRVTPGSPTVPGSVRSLTAKSVKGAIKVTWAAPSDTGGTGRVTYQYRVGSKPWTPAKTTSVTIKGKPGTRITVLVRAVNSAGAGPESRTTATPR